MKKDVKNLNSRGEGNITKERATEYDYCCQKLCYRWKALISTFTWSLHSTSLLDNGGKMLSCVGKYVNGPGLWVTFAAGKFWHIHKIHLLGIKPILATIKLNLVILNTGYPEVFWYGFLRTWMMRKCAWGSPMLTFFPITSPLKVRTWNSLPFQYINHTLGKGS